MEELGPTFLEFNGVPAFVVLRYDEYQRLLALAAPSPLKLFEYDPATRMGELSTILDGLTTSSTDRATLSSPLATPDRPAPNDDLIPHDVVVAAVHNHWSLVRAWREYLGLKQVTLAQRLNVTIPQLEQLEVQHVSLRPPIRQWLADGLGIRYEQLLPRRRRLRRTAP